MSKSEITSFVLDSISEINQQLPTERQIGSDLATVILGQKSELDSLSLINLIIEIEEKISSSSGRRIPILDKGIMSEEHGSFYTVGELIDWIIKQP